MKRHILVWLGIAGLTGNLWAVEMRSDLVGTVTLDDGSVATNAIVFIYTAGPKEGSASVCPSCYADCGKKAKTDARGTFKIESLDPTLRFRLLVVSPGCASQYVEKTDPAEGPKRITLKRLDAEKLNAPTRIAGMVLDADGEALVGAVISPEGVQWGDGGRWGGTDEFVDPLAVTDEHGRFWLYCTNGVDWVRATVTGRDAAKRWVELRPGRDHLLRMTRGALVTGQIEKDGVPLADVMVGLVTVDRTCGSFLLGDELATDQDGRFLIPNVPPDREFVLYAKMESMRGRGMVPVKEFNSGKDGNEVNLEVVSVKPGFRIFGRLVLSDGKPIPPKTRLLLSREKAWDNAEAEVTEDGRFEFRDVPTESVALSVRVRGYKFSTRNPSLD